MKNKPKDAYLEDDDVVPDGTTIRVPIMVMDAAQRAIAGVDLSDYAPGFRLAADAAVRDARGAARDAYNEMVKRAQTAGRTPHRHVPDAPQPDSADCD
jgi:hypothetical protein